jgi:hypothetical protein
MSPVEGKVWPVTRSNGRMIRVYAVAFTVGKGVERIHEDAIPLWVLEIKIIAFIKASLIGMMQLKNGLVKRGFLVLEFDGFIVNCIARADFAGF